MRQTLTTGLLLTALAIAGNSAASTPKKAATTPAAKTPAASPAATHAVRGVVKSIDASSLVITRSGHKAQLLSFVLNPSTAREGTVDVGSTVAVRYRNDGKALLATAVAVQPTPPAHHMAAKSK
jgi:hypothetical protein